MKKLYLLRHAESSRPQGVSDHDRPINENGKQMCKVINSYLLENKILPQMVLCSDSVRTMATAKLVFSEIKVNIIQSKRLYNATIGEVLKEIAKIRDNVCEIMIIGHNPSMQQLAVMLARRSDKLLLQDIKNEYPVCALAVYRFELEKWCELQPESGFLERFIKPFSK